MLPSTEFLVQIYPVLRAKSLIDLLHVLYLLPTRKDISFAIFSALIVTHVMVKSFICPFVQLPLLQFINGYDAERLGKVGLVMWIATGLAMAEAAISRVLLIIQRSETKNKPEADFLNLLANIPHEEQMKTLKVIKLAYVIMSNGLATYFFFVQLSPMVRTSDRIEITIDIFYCIFYCYAQLYFGGDMTILLRIRTNQRSTSVAISPDSSVSISPQILDV